MRVPLEWLKEFVAIRLSPEALAERLTMAGLEVTGIESVEGQPVLDIEVTPNRADCLSILGVAREVAAITGQRLKLPSARGSPAPALARVGPGGLGVRPPRLSYRAGRGGKSRPPGARSPEPRANLTVRIEDRKGCSHYVGRLIEGVKIGSSPAWMQQRLIACGVRPISTIVDITNYVLLEYGQPLHAFDADRLAGRTILVRRARAAERMTTLDEVTRELAGDMLVIADAERAIAVAGVMGGLGSEVTPKTVSVVLESALFDPVTVRRTARALGLATESSYRFERGVDPVGVETASQRAAELMRSIAGGVERVVRDVGAAAPSRAAITVRVDGVNRWLGTRLSPATVRADLARLSCRVLSSEGQGTLRVTPPSFRRDLTLAADLYEEVARATGYKQIPSRLPMASLATGRTGTRDHFGSVQALRRTCTSLGLTEAITWSLVSAADLAHCRGPEAVRLANPLSQDHAALRPSLLLGLLQTVRYNVARGAARVALFELGHVFGPGREAAEQLRLGMILTGLWARDWQGTQACDFFRLKGLVESLVSEWTALSAGMQPADAPWSEPGQGGVVVVNGQQLGAVGQVARRLVEALDIEQDVWFAELDAEALLALGTRAKTVDVPIAFPPVRRDVSLVVADTIPFEEIDRVIREVGGPLAIRIELIDRYAGRQTPPGKHSLTFSIEYRDRARTLTAEAVDALHRCIGQALVSRFTAQLR